MNVLFIVLPPLLAVGAMATYVFLNQDLSEWHIVNRYRPVKLVDGTVSTSGYLWARKIRGEWQYRELTADEYNSHMADVSV